MPGHGPPHTADACRRRPRVADDAASDWLPAQRPCCSRARAVQGPCRWMARPCLARRPSNPRLCVGSRSCASPQLRTGLGYDAQVRFSGWLVRRFSCLCVAAAAHGAGLRRTRRSGWTCGGWTCDRWYRYGGPQVLRAVAHQPPPPPPPAPPPPLKPEPPLEALAAAAEAFIALSMLEVRAPMLEAMP